MPKEKTYQEAQADLMTLERENDQRLERFSAYQGQLVKAHKRNVPSPVVKDKEGRLHWLNRAQRRKQKIKLA